MIGSGVTILHTHWHLKGLMTSARAAHSTFTRDPTKKSVSLNLLHNCSWQTLFSLDPLMEQSQEPFIQFHFNINTWLFNSSRTKAGNYILQRKDSSCFHQSKKQRRQQAEQSVRLQLCHQTQTQTHIHQTVCFHNSHCILHEIEVCEELIKTNRTSMETGLKGARWASGELQLLGLTHRVIIFLLFSLLKNYLSSCRMSTVLTAAVKSNRLAAKV